MSPTKYYFLHIHVSNQSFQIFSWSHPFWSIPTFLLHRDWLLASLCPWILLFFLPCFGESHPSVAYWERAQGTLLICKNLSPDLTPTDDYLGLIPNWMKKSISFQFEGISQTWSIKVCHWEVFIHLKVTCLTLYLGSPHFKSLYAVLFIFCDSWKCSVILS